MSSLTTVQKLHLIDIDSKVLRKVYCKTDSLSKILSFITTKQPKALNYNKLPKIQVTFKFHLTVSHIMTLSEKRENSHTHTLLSSIDNTGEF